MAKAKPKKKEELEELEDDELEDLEDLDEEEDEDEADSDEDEDEDSDDEEDEDEDEDEEETPPAKSKKKGKKRTDGKIGSAELAEALGTNGRNLRVMLRDKGVEVDPETKRYVWDSVEDALSDMGFKSIKSAQKALKESRDKRLDVLKERAAEARAAKAKGKKKSSKK